MEQKEYEKRKYELFSQAIVLIGLSILCTGVLYLYLLRTPKGWAAPRFNFSTDEQNIIILILLLIPVFTAIVMFIRYGICLFILKKRINGKGNAKVET